MDRYTQNLSPALAALGATVADLSTHIQPAAERIQALKQRIENAELPAFSSALNGHAAAAQALHGWSDRFTDVIFLGMGGSSLGGKLINQFADTSGLSKPTLRFIDFLSPCGIEGLMAGLPLKTTGVIVISKSGGTMETFAQALLFAQAYEKAGLPLGTHWLTVTEPTPNPLRQFAEHHNIPTLPHDPALGGRYSVGGETGVLPALLKGLNVTGFHTGMQEVVTDFLHNPLTCAPVMGAALHALAKTHGKTNTVIYNYGEKFHYLPAWFEQLWAESLGKNGHGTTPVGAIGPASQHSIQQLFLDGPADKLFTVLLPQSNGWGEHSPLPENPFKPELGTLTLGTIQQAMGEGTIAALGARNHPVRTLTFNKLNTQTLGAILMHFMLETALTAQLWDINPFDQPAVEESKIQTLAALQQLQPS